MTDSTESLATVGGDPASQGGETGLISVPGYTITEKLGQGGMGQVYLGFEAESGKKVVVKRSPRVGKGSLAWLRFRREVNALTLLRHPNIVRYLDHGVSWEAQEETGEESGHPYLVMDYVGGQSLQDVIGEWLKEPAEQRVARLRELFARLAEALEDCHRVGLIHRDIKPANLVYDKQQSRLVLIDFGLVKVDHTTFDASVTGMSTKLTSQGAILGTPGFMAPEQFFARSEEIAPASDVWSFGATLYYALSGRTPYRAEVLAELTLLLDTQDPRPLKGHSPELPDWLCDLVMSCLNRDAKGRPSMREISRVLSGRRRRPTLVIAAFLLLLVALALGAWLLLGR